MPARERLRKERTLRARRRRRIRVAGVGAGVVALIAAATAGILIQSNGDTTGKARSAYAGHFAPVTLNADNSVTMAQPGVTKPVLDVYEDFQCAQCRAFERSNGGVIQQLAGGGDVATNFIKGKLEALRQQYGRSATGRERNANRSNPSPASLQFNTAKLPIEQHFWLDYDFRWAGRPCPTDYNYPQQGWKRRSTCRPRDPIGAYPPRQCSVWQPTLHCYQFPVVLRRTKRQNRSKLPLQVTRISEI